MNKLICWVIAIVSITVFSTALATLLPWDYRIKLTKNMNGLNIVANSFVGPAVTLGLENHSAKTARCTASFVSYPHTPSKDETVSATVAAGKRATLAYPLEKLGGNISTAFVNVKCVEK